MKICVLGSRSGIPAHRRCRVADAQAPTRSEVIEGRAPQSGLVPLGVPCYVPRHALRLNSTSRGPPLSGDGLHLSVLGAFQFWVANEALPTLSGGSQRLLAFLALRDRAVTRIAAAGTLWPDATQSHAYSSLRSALSRLDEVTRDAVVTTPLELSFAEDVAVDFREAQAIAHRLVDLDAVPRAFDLSAAAVTALSTDLLPDWYEDWVVVENEDWRQLRLHALEALADRLTENGRLGEAVYAARAAVKTEPLPRERAGNARPRSSCRKQPIRSHQGVRKLPGPAAGSARHPTHAGPSGSHRGPPSAVTARSCPPRRVQMCPRTGLAC